MEFSEVLRKRRMVRAYDPDRPVPEESLAAVLAAALRAPSAGYTQAVAVLALVDQSDRDRFWALTTDSDEDADDLADAWLSGMRSAPALLTVWTSRDAYLDRYALPDKGWTDRAEDRWAAPYWFVDAGMASMAMLLTAVDHGLGSCFFGVPPEVQDAVREAFGVPPDELSVGVISLGFPVPAAELGSPKRRARTPSAELIHRGRWGG